MRGLAPASGAIFGRWQIELVCHSDLGEADHHSSSICDKFAPSQAQMVMSQVAIYFGIAPAIAPIMGGWLFLLAGWHIIFLVFGRDRCRAGGCQLPAAALDVTRHTAPAVQCAQPAARLLATGPGSTLCVGLLAWMVLLRRWPQMGRAGVGGPMEKPDKRWW